MAQIKAKKIVMVEITTGQIERYLIAHKWTLDAGEYRTPVRGECGVRLSDGVQNLINSIAAIENRECSFSLCEDILALDRNR